MRKYASDGAASIAIRQMWDMSAGALCEEDNVSERTEALAQRFEKANSGFIEMVQGCSDEQWLTKCPGENRSVAVVASHVAGAYRAIVGWVQTIASAQQLPPLTIEIIDQLNAQHAERHPNPTKEEVVTALQRNGEAAAAMVRGLTDEQLDRKGAAPLFGSEPVSAQQLIEYNLIGHMRGHQRDIQAALRG